jgi:hypothetical protein
MLVIIQYKTAIIYFEFHIIKNTVENNNFASYYGHEIQSLTYRENGHYKRKYLPLKG